MTEARDPQKTRKHIDSALGRYLVKTDIVERTKYAWAYLRGTRRLGDDPLCRQLGISPPIVNGAPRDPNLADAEHYMYARFLAGSTGDASVRVLVGGYDLMKAVMFKTKGEAAMRTDPRFPVLPPAMDSVTWGLRGAEDGLKDYAALNGGKSGELGSAFRENREIVSGNFRKLY